jgi:hypothetical protein
LVSPPPPPPHGLSSYEQAKIDEVEAELNCRQWAHQMLNSTQAELKRDLS